MAKKAELRRSCTFCRTRKIACSGERICNACRSRSIECVYDLEIAKGRPRLNKTTSTRASISAGPAGPSPIMLEDGEPGDGGHSITSAVNPSITPLTGVMAELEVMFRENFGEDPMAAPSNQFQDRVARFNRNLAAGRASQGPSTPAGSLTYPGFLALLMQDLAETVTGKFGDLGCHPFFGPGERFYRACMLQDTTKTMFDTACLPSPSTSTPSGGEADILADYNSHLITQHLEVWMSNHPLSIIISKSLLLRDLRSQTANRVLLAVMLADAHHFADNSAKGDRLLQWAVSQLSNIPAGQEDLTTAQITLLLGWFHVCRGHSRRALCYVGYAGRITTKLASQLHESPLTGQTHINGIDRGAVEAEMIHHMYWVMLALTVWSFIQMDMPLADLLPAQLLQVLPARTTPDSTLLQLDRATDNLSTLKPQLSSLQSVWLLSHVTVLSAHLYALYPQHLRSPPEPQPWQDLMLHRLNRLLRQGRSLTQICSDSRNALLDIIVVLQKESAHGRGEPTLLALYLAVSIHLLFPRDETGHHVHNSQTFVLSDTLFQQLIASIQDLKQLFPAISSVARHDSSQPASTGSAGLHFYLLALDALGRALMYVLTVWDRVTAVEQRVWQDRLRGLLDGGLAMHDLFEYDALLQDHRWRSVKKHLKTACKGIKGVLSGSRDQGSRSSSSSVSSLDLSFALPSRPTPAMGIPTSEEGRSEMMFPTMPSASGIPSSISSSISHTSREVGLSWPGDGQILPTQEQGPRESSHPAASDLSDFDLAPFVSLGSIDSMQNGDERSRIMQQFSPNPMSLPSFWHDPQFSPAHHLVGTMPPPSLISLADLGMGERGQKRSSEKLGGLSEGDTPGTSADGGTKRRMKGMSN
ncbi:transcriptional regulator family: Fungal Specific TF [Aspergillus niger]|nr:transcriptional regulator family: Fungal Specific TF [Aspergillus niger]